MVTRAHICRLGFPPSPNVGEANFLGEFLDSLNVTAPMVLSFWHTEIKKSIRIVGFFLQFSLDCCIAGHGLFIPVRVTVCKISAGCADDYADGGVTVSLGT